MDHRPWQASWVSTRRGLPRYRITDPGPLWRPSDGVPVWAPKKLLQTFEDLFNALPTAAALLEKSVQQTCALPPAWEPAGPRSLATQEPAPPHSRAARSWQVLASVWSTTPREFSALLLEVDSNYSGLLMYNNVIWLSRGKVLERFVECFEEIKEPPYKSLARWVPGPGEAVGPWIRVSLAPGPGEAAGPWIRVSLAPGLGEAAGPWIRVSLGPWIRVSLALGPGEAVGPWIRVSLGPWIRVSLGPGSG
ncbi:hypothetical protein QTO34_016928 [Cnephaeus nilssonii]|uniref:Uncharacterized protein n=1 Tax=Cnephaeus nilssonii TaxID=3371016 RepID=A0AA40I3T9_CNENI|nr:hypothetical protein QTO34_016928 [Eptesicus nilssonii]